MTLPAKACDANDVPLARDSRGVHLTFRAWPGAMTVRSSCRGSCRRRSGSLDFPAPSQTLRVAARVFEVFRLRHVGPVLLAKSASEWTLGSWLPFRAVVVRSARISPGFLPWNSSAASPSTRLSGVHSRMHRCMLRSRRFQLRDPVPSSWFRTTPMGSSARRARACRIPLPILRSAVFPASELPFQPVDRPIRRARGIPRDALHTPRRIPTDGSRSTSLWPLPPCRCLRSVSALPPGPVAGSRFRRFDLGDARLRGFPPLSGP